MKLEGNICEQLVFDKVSDISVWSKRRKTEKENEENIWRRKKLFLEEKYNGGGIGLGGKY